MENAFCRLFEVQDHQILFQLKKDDDIEDPEIIVITSRLNGVIVETSISGFKSSNGAKDALVKITQQHAEKWFNEFKNLTT